MEEALTAVQKLGDNPVGIEKLTSLEKRHHGNCFRLPIRLSVLAILVWGFLSANGSTQELEAKRKYPFPLPPRTIIERLPEMDLGTPQKITVDQWKILEKAWSLRDASEEVKQEAGYDSLVVDALLSASGVQTEAELANYRDKVAKVIAGAREAVKNAESSQHAGESLMKFLHADLMKNGYEADQTSFSAIFDTAKYNCVSATAMYYVVGNALGLKMRLISIPGGFALSGHACLDLIDKEKTYEVEPTNPDGFDWATKLSQPGVFSVGYQPDRKRGYTIDPICLASLVYSNRGVYAASAEHPDRLAAASLGLCAVMISPYDESATGNVEAVFTNWGPKLADEARYEEAIRTLAFGHKAIGSDKVRNNLSIVWSDYIQSLMKAGKDREAQAAIARAAADLPMDSEFQEGQCWDRYINRLFRDNETADLALEAVDRALAVIPDTQRPGMLKTRTSIYRRYSQVLLDKADVEGALKLLVRGYKIDPNDEELHSGIAYYLQESFGKVDSGGAAPQAAVAHYKNVREAFPKLDFLAGRAEAHVHWSLRALFREKKFVEALAAAKAYAPLAKSSSEELSFQEQVWEAWGDSFVEEKDWTNGIKKYLEGLQVIPNGERLTRCAESTIDRWAGVSMDAGDWDAAIKVYDYGLTHLSDNGHLKHNREYCVERKARAANGK